MEHTRMLTRFGLDIEAEHVYWALAARTAARTTELAASIGREPQRIRAALTDLITHALAQPMTDGRFRACAPELALRAHLTRREQELNDDRAVVQRLARVYRDTRAVREATEPVQLVTGRVALAAVLRDLHDSARFEVRTLIKAKPDESHARELTQQSLRLSCRTVYQHSPMEDYGGPSARCGEQMRMAPQIPVSMVLADSSCAVIALDQGAEEDPLAVVIRHRNLIDVLDGLFEAIWTAAVPVAPPDGAPREAPSADDLRLLSLLAAGLPDSAMAAHLGVSKRTVERRTRRLFNQAGVSTRFQLGLHAARKGWI